MAPRRSDSSPGPTAVTVVGAALRRAVDRLEAELPGVLADDGPEAVHQARVATRRLRSDLRTFRPVLETEWADARRAELRPLTDALGAVRDADVLDERLVRSGAALGPEHARAVTVIRARLAHERDAARAALLVRLADPGTDDLRRALADAVATPPVRGTVAGRDAAEVLTPLVAGPWRRLARAVADLGPDPADAELHRIRILTKRCRYAAEAVDPAVAGRAARFARATAELQDRLGTWHDAVATASWLGAVAPDLDPAAAYVAGRLAQLELDDAARRRDRWRSAWRRVRAPKRRRFLGTDVR